MIKQITKVFPLLVVFSFTYLVWAGLSGKFVPNDNEFISIIAGYVVGGFTVVFTYRKK